MYTIGYLRLGADYVVVTGDRKSLMGHASCFIQLTYSLNFPRLLWIRLILY